MAVNKVVYGTTTLVDLTEDTVQADKLLEGYTAHDSSGNLVTGTFKPSSGGGEETGGKISNISYMTFTIPKYYVSISQPLAVINGGNISSITTE